MTDKIENDVRWDCDILLNDDKDIWLVDNNGDEIVNPKQYVGKVLKLVKMADMTSDSEYYYEYDIPNYFSGEWGYIGQFLFELIPDSQFLSKYGDEWHLGILIAVKE